MGRILIQLTVRIIVNGGEREKREANLKLLPTIEDSQVGDGRDRVLFPLQN